MEEKRALYVGPFCGELGWEIGNWLPHVRYKHYEKKSWNRRIFCCKPGHEFLYSQLADSDSTERGSVEWRCVAAREGCVEGNAFLRQYPEQYEAYHQLCSDAHTEADALERDGYAVSRVFLPESYYRLHGFRQKRWARILPDPALVDLWRSRAGSGFVLFPVRKYGRSPQKNTPDGPYRFVYEWASRRGLHFITVGKQYESSLSWKPCPEHRVLGTDLLGKTTLADLVALLHLCALAVGSSTGPLHLASQCGTPHVVWGGGWEDVRKRYLVKWNRLGTLCRHIGSAWVPELPKLERALDEVITKENPQYERDVYEEG